MTKDTKKKGSGTSTDAWSHDAVQRHGCASCGTRSPVGVPPRLLPWGFRPVRLNFKPGFLGRDRYDVFAKWALPTPTCPSPVNAPHAPAVMPVGLIPEVARERIVTPRAGTALDPSSGIPPEGVLW